MAISWRSYGTWRSISINNPRFFHEQPCATRNLVLLEPGILVTKELGRHCGSTKWKGRYKFDQVSRCLLLSSEKKWCLFNCLEELSFRHLFIVHLLSDVRPLWVGCVGWSNSQQIYTTVWFYMVLFFLATRLQWGCQHFSFRGHYCTSFPT